MVGVQTRVPGWGATSSVEYLGDDDDDDDDNDDDDDDFLSIWVGI